MLQIIGWMGCFYLILKGIEFFTTGHRNEKGQVVVAAQVGAALCWLGAIAFYFILEAQVAGTQASIDSIPSISDYSTEDYEDALGAAEAAIRDAEEAARDADAAIDASE